MASRLAYTATKLLAAGGTLVGAAAAHRYQEVKREQSNLPSQELWSFENKPQVQKKRVVVIGGGVVGVTAAYKLALNGHSVVLLEPRDRAGEECSSCAAGGMQRSNPVVDRGTWVSVTKSFIPWTRFVLGGRYEPYKFFHIDWPVLTDPFFLRWSLTFAKTSLFPCSDQKRLQEEMLGFTNYAVQDMIDMMTDKGDTMSKVSGFNPSGSLSLSYDDEEPIQSTAKKDNPSRGNTLEPSKQLTGDEIITQEASILHQHVQPVRAKFEYESCAASSERFTKELADRCAHDPKLDVTFLYNTRVKGVAVTPASSDGKNLRVSQLRTNCGVIDIPDDGEVLLAAGAWTPHVAALMGLYVPVYPLKGYAMSISAEKVLSSTNLKPEDLPTRIVCDKYMFTSRLGDEIHITSIGEFSDWSTRPTSTGE